MSYTLFGPEWKQELMEIPVPAIANITRVSKNKGESKSAYIDRIAEIKKELIKN